MKRKTCCLLILGLFVFGGVTLSADEDVPAVLISPGPNGVKLRFSAPEQGYYRRAEALRPGHAPVPIDFGTWNPSVVTLVNGMGTYGLRDKRQKVSPDADWSLKVWSLDGRYVVLVTYIVDDDGKIDYRNNQRTNAYDTTTGKRTGFESRTEILANDTFSQWSPTKPDVALLYGRGASDFEEAYPVKE